MRCAPSSNVPALPCTPTPNTFKKGVTEWLEGWKKRQWRTSSREPVKNADLWQELDALLPDHEISWHWVRGHNGHPGNELADALANRGVEELLAKKSV